MWGTRMMMMETFNEFIEWSRDVGKWEPRVF